MIVLHALLTTAKLEAQFAFPNAMLYRKASSLKRGTVSGIHQECPPPTDYANLLHWPTNKGAYFNFATEDLAISAFVFANDKYE